MRNNTLQFVKVLEVSSSEIKYKRTDMQDSPIYTEIEAKIKMIKYSNGF